MKLKVDICRFTRIFFLISQLSAFCHGHKVQCKHLPYGLCPRDADSQRTERKSGVLISGQRTTSSHQQLSFFEWIWHPSGHGVCTLVSIYLCSISVGLARVVPIAHAQQKDPGPKFSPGTWDEVSFHHTVDIQGLLRKAWSQIAGILWPADYANHSTQICLLGFRLGRFLSSFRPLFFLRCNGLVQPGARGPTIWGHHLGNPLVAKGPRQMCQTFSISAKGSSWGAEVTSLPGFF